MRAYTLLEHTVGTSCIVRNVIRTFPPPTFELGPSLGHRREDQLVRFSDLVLDEQGTKKGGESLQGFYVRISLVQLCDCLRLKPNQSGPSGPSIACIGQMRYLPRIEDICVGCLVADGRWISIRLGQRG